MSKYVRQTGDGYIGIYAVGNGGLKLTKHALRSTELTAGERGYVLDHEDGLHVRHSTSGVEPLATPKVVADYEGEAISVGITVLREHVGVESGDDVRVYEADPGIVIVNADADPRINGGGSR